MPDSIKTEYWSLSFVSIGNICMYHRFMIVYCAYLDNEFGLYCNFRPSVAGHERLLDCGAEFPCLCSSQWDFTRVTSMLMNVISKKC